MSGGLMQLVAYGAQDVYLTGNPQITFFKVVYRRHTNFAIECIEVPFNGTANFGRKTQVTISRNGDLIHRVYLFVNLPEVELSAGSQAAYVRRLGHALVHSIEVDIGGSQIDKQYGTWMDIWYELARPAGDQERGYFKMIGDVPALTDYNSDNKPAYNLYIPLYFWFNRHVGLALPLIALQYHEVRFEIEFTNVNELFVGNSHFFNNDVSGLQMQDAKLLVDYIYLDSEERRRFAQVGHEYLIEQLQFTGVESANQVHQKYQLNFNHPSKELIWAVNSGNYNSGNAFLCYTGKDNWNCMLDECACKILLDSMVLLPGSVCDVDQYGNPVVVSPGEQPPSYGTWEAFAPGESGTTKNGQINVCNNCEDKCLWINTSSLLAKNLPSYNLTGKISADICVTADCLIKCCDVETTLTVRDLSIPVSGLIDTRYNRSDDVIVYQPMNFGVLIDGTGNVVHSALIQLNGHDRFERREGDYFNYVQPWQHHTNTPKDGVNVYSFGLYPEQHQPSGTANLSRIDNTVLLIHFEDPTYMSGLPALDILNPDNAMYIYDQNYNILRIMSGMGGLAYSN